MGQDSSIEWTDATWNPVRGCSRVSPGCEQCYAEKQAARFSGPGMPYEGLVRFGKQGARWTGKVRIIPERLADPLRWRKPKKIFVNSMSDLFHESLANEEIAAVFGVMAASPRHTFQILTKRAKRMREWFEWLSEFEQEGGPPPDHTVLTCASNYIDIDQVEHPWPLPNVWLGVSVEDQQRANERIPDLIQTPAAVRFLSYEPALGQVELDRWVAICKHWQRADSLHSALWCPPWPLHKWKHQALVSVGYRHRIDWVIVGGESGSGARPFDIQWAANMVAQCKAAGIPVFVKQLGAKPWDSDQPIDLVLDGEGAIDGNVLTLASRKGGDMAEWSEDLRVREFPRVVS